MEETDQHQQDQTDLSPEQIHELAVETCLRNLDALLASLRIIDIDLAAIVAPTGMSTKHQLRVFGKLHQATKRLEGQADKAKKKRDALNERTLEALDEIGLQNAPLSEIGVTVFRERTLWASNEKADDEDTDSVYERSCAALEAAGLGEYVKPRFDTGSLSAYFRERERELEDAYREEHGLGPEEPVVVDPEDLIPEPLRGVIKVSEVVKAKAKQS